MAEGRFAALEGIIRGIPVNEEKDQKARRGSGSGKPTGKTTGKTSPSDAPRAAGKPPSSGPPARSAPEEQARIARKNTAAPRRRQPSIEEISSSLLLSDDSTSTKLPDLEELSGSLLLDDSTGVKLAPLPAATPPASPSRPAPAAHRALMGLPDLPPSAPAPRLDPRLAATTAAREASGAPPPSAPDSSTQVYVTPPPAAMAEAVGNVHGAHRNGEGARPTSEPIADSADAAPRATSAVHGDVEVTSLPLGGIFAAAETVKRGLGKLRSILVARPDPQDPRRTWFLAVVAMAGLTVGVSLVVLAVSLTRGGSSTSEASPEPSATARDESQPVPAVAAAPVSATPAASSLAVALAAPPEPTRTADVSSTPCGVVGPPRVVAPAAIVQAGIEVRTLGNEVALGFAPSDHQATALRLDATSLSAAGTIDAQSADPVRRVVPLLSAKGALSLAVDVDRDEDPVRGRRTIPFDPPLQIGASGGNLVWARADGAVGGTLWPIEGDGAVDAARGATELRDNTSTTAIVVRHADAIWIGTATGQDALSPRGGLTRVRGLGSAVGSPAVAINDGVVVAVWADRASSNDPWHLQWVHFKAGEAPGDPDTFVPPMSGKGAQAMSPSVATVSGGRFLLVWTEGPTSRHDVRALTLSSDGQPLGKPLAVSMKKANAGQGQAAVTAARQGLVAFLESTDSGFQVVATPIRCGR
jgi:hypothetical protein